MAQVDYRRNERLQEAHAIFVIDDDLAPLAHRLERRATHCHARSIAQQRLHRPAEHLKVGSECGLHDLRRLEQRGDEDHRELAMLGSSAARALEKEAKELWPRAIR